MKKVLLLALAILCPCTASAQSVAPIDTTARQAFLLDANTDTALFAKNADAQMPTSSMSKMMTIYVVFEALRNGKIKLDDTLPVSENAWRQTYKQNESSMFLKIGQQVRVEDLIRGVIIQSGNDAAVVLAEYLGGSEQNFSEMMNVSAQKIGMKNSHFVNAAGLPNPEHYSTAHDLALLALALVRDFPEHYHYFSELEFTYNGIKQGNRNPLLYRAMNVDGLKTGHTDAGGYGLTASAIRNGRRLIVVLNGMDSMQARADESAKVLDWGYREFGLFPVVKAGDKLAEAKVWLGEKPTVALNAAEDVTLTLAHTAHAGLKTDTVFNQPVNAPVTKGQTLGKLVITAPGMPTKEINLVAAEDVPQLGFFSRTYEKLKHMMHKDS